MSSKVEAEIEKIGLFMSPDTCTPDNLGSPLKTARSWKPFVFFSKTTRAWKVLRRFPDGGSFSRSFSIVRYGDDAEKKARLCLAAWKSAIDSGEEEKYLRETPYAPTSVGCAQARIKPPQKTQGVKLKSKGLWQAFNIDQTTGRIFQRQFSVKKYGEEARAMAVAFLLEWQSAVALGTELGFWERYPHRSRHEGKPYQNAIPVAERPLTTSEGPIPGGVILNGIGEGGKVALLRQELEETQAKAEETEALYNSIVTDLEAELDTLKRENAQLRAEAHNMRSRVEFLTKTVKKREEEEVFIPATLDDIESWARENLGGSVVVLNRALRMAKKSEFANPGLAYRALLLLRDAYVPLRQAGGGGPDFLALWEAGLAELGLVESPTGSRHLAGEHEDEYSVVWNGRRCFFDRHLKSGNSRDKRFTFRLYFFWDDVDQCVVVGSFPEHLTSRLS